MKASRFVKAFEDQVDFWERTLSKILEVIEITLTVQRQWMYLEVGLLFHIYAQRIHDMTSFSFFALEHFCGRRYSEAAAKGDSRV